MPIDDDPDSPTPPQPSTEQAVDMPAEEPDLDAGNDAGNDAEPTGTQPAPTTAKSGPAKQGITSEFGVFGNANERRLMPAGYAIWVVCIALIMTLFLDADGLVQTAERQPLGWQRTTALAIMHPIQDISSALYLNRPRKWLATATGRERNTTITPTEDVVIATSVPAGTDTPKHAPTAPTTTIAPLRVPTSSDPLRVLVAGDSLSGHLGPSLADHLQNYPAHVTLDDHVGTGLARPDVIDWPNELTDQMNQLKPDVVVLIFGGNDNQDLRTASGWVPISDYPAWKAEYQRRIAQLMDIVAKPGVSVWWIGLPVVDRAKLQKVVPDINAMLQLEAGARPGRVFYVDSNKALATADGGYRSYAPTPDGGQVQIRERDGVHPTRTGIDWVVDLFAPDLIKLRKLDAPPPATTTTSPPTASSSTSPAD